MCGILLGLRNIVPKKHDGHPMKRRDDDTPMREMPKGWLPEGLVVVGKHDGAELAFALPMDAGRVVPDRLASGIDALARAMWQALEMRRLGKPTILENGVPA